MSRLRRPFSDWRPPGLEILLLGLAITACAQADRSTHPTAVMTFNVRYGTANDGANAWPNRVGLVTDLIRDHAPDVLGVQEALRFQLDEIRDRLPEFAAVGVGRDDGGEAGEYAAILYRTERFALERTGTFWFSDTPDVPGSVSWGNRITRICTWAYLTDRETRAKLYVYNVHFDHESQPSRERAAHMLASRIASRGTDDPVIVLGDFNAGEGNPAIRFLTANPDALPPTPSDGVRPAGLADTYRAIHPTDTVVGTFNAFRGERHGEKIDWILISPHWSVLDAAILRDEVEGRYPSDHFPVTALVSPVPGGRSPG